MIAPSCALGLAALAAWDGWRRWLAFRREQLASESALATVEARLAERLAKLERTVEPLTLAHGMRR